MSAELEREYVFQEILEQPAIVRRHGRRPAPEWPPRNGRVVVTGTGDSLAAAELAAELYPARYEACSAMRASALAGGLGAGDVLVGISVSGRTPRVREALLRAQGAGASGVAVTDDPAGPLAAAADRTWLIDASPPEALLDTEYQDPAARQYVGYHHDVAQTKTFLAALLTLARAADPEADLQRLAGTVERLCAPELRAPILERAPEWAEARQAFFLASGSAMPLARFGAYKLFEFDRLAHFTDVEEYCHTHYFVTRPGDALVFLVHDAASARRAAEVAPVLVELFGARSILIASDDLALPAEGLGHEVVVPAGQSSLERHVALLVGLEWVSYLWGRVGAPDVNTFHAGYDTERLVGASLRTIRGSRIDA